MDNLLLNLETEFYFITGVYLEGVSGLLFGFLFFSLAMYLIGFENSNRNYDKPACAAFSAPIGCL